MCVFIGQENFNYSCTMHCFFTKKLMCKRWFSGRERLLGVGEDFLCINHSHLTFLLFLFTQNYSLLIQI